MAVSPIAPVAPVSPDVSSANVFATQSTATQSVANVFAATVAAQDTNSLLNNASSVSGSASQADEVALNESLTSLGPEALIELNAVENNGAAGIANTKLTPTQLQEMQILQNDIAQIEAAEQIAPAITVTQNGTDVNLSVAAVNALNDIAVVENIGSANALTVAQIQQAAAVVAPLINQPLNSQTVTQLQSALLLAGFNPDQLSLQNLLLVMNYAIGETAEAGSPDTVAMNEMVTEMEATEE